MLQNKPHRGKKNQRYGFVKVSPALGRAPAWRRLCFGKAGAAAMRLLKKLPVSPTPGPTPFFGVWYMVTFTAPTPAWGRVLENRVLWSRAQESWGHLEIGKRGTEPLRGGVWA